MERIDKLEYTREDGQKVQNNPYYNGPTEFLVARVAYELLQDEDWVLIFGEHIDAYKRNDYSIRNLPALRVYNDTFIKEFDSWFINGDIKLDIILPASLRRDDTQQVQDSLTAALLQQFRRTTFFTTLCDNVPGLNELGKRFSVDKSLGFEWGENWVPLTQITLNFRLDLRVWDEYLTQTNRTKDEPFDSVLGDLKRIASTIRGLDNDEEVQAEEEIIQTTT